MEAIGYWAAGAAVGISVLFLVLRSFNSWFYGSRERLPPGTMGWPLVGESLELIRGLRMGGKPNLFMDKRIAKYGKLSSYKTHLFGAPVIILPTYEGAKLVLSNPELFKFGYPNPAGILGKETFALLTGARRKRFRDILMDALAGPVALKNVITIMDRETKRVLDEAASKKSFDMFYMCRTLVQSSEMELFFGPCNQEVFDLFARTFGVFVRGVFGFPINFPGSSRYYAIKARLEVQKWLQSRLDQRRAEGKLHETDAMGYLMNTVDETGKKLPDEVITCNLFHFFLASQSTYRPVFWMLHNLSKNPRFIPELREEHQKMAATKKPGEILTMEEMNRLHFTKKVWDETLRLLNLFPWLFGTANVDVDFHGITIPKGWKALPFLRTMHMDPDIYPDPDSFNPHRWNDLKPEVAPFAPFAQGQRHCPGSSQANYQACLFIYTLITKYNWEFLELDSPVRYIPEALPMNCMARLIPLEN